MADSSFLQSNKELKLVDAGDGTFHQSVDISGLNTISVIETVVTCSNVGNVASVEAIMDGTVSISTGTVNVGNNIVVGTVLDGTVSVGSITSMGTLLNGTVSISTGTVNVGNNIVVGTVLDGTVSMTTGTIHTLLNGTVSLSGAIATAPSHPTYGVTSVSQTVSATSATRKYLLIANSTDTTLWLGLGTASVIEKGIPLFANGSTYEMSTAMGNLFTGDVTAINSGGTVSKTIQVVEG